ncbi:TPA: hypothetical protein ACKP22_000385 [Pseudomonas putida]
MSPADELRCSVIRVNPKADALLVGRCFARDDMLLVAPKALPRPSACCDGKIVEVPAVALANRFENGTWHYQDGDTMGTVMPDVRLRLSSLIMTGEGADILAGAAGGE